MDNMDFKKRIAGAAPAVSCLVSRGSAAGACALLSIAFFNHPRGALAEILEEMGKGDQSALLRVDRIDDAVFLAARSSRSLPDGEDPVFQAVLVQLLDALKTIDELRAHLVAASTTSAAGPGSGLEPSSSTSAGGCKPLET